jgi:hypothetical protein
MVANIKMGEVLLALGELTAQERRTCKALLGWVAYRIRSRVGHQTSRCAPVLSSAAISDAANAERLPEPFLGPEAQT